MFLPATRQTTSQAIPRQIWQTTRSHNISEATQRSVASWKKNEGFEYHLHVDDEVIEFLHHAGLGKVVNKILETNAPRVMIADIWRYAIVYHHGGFYGDIDTVSKKPIRDWLPPTSTPPQLPVVPADPNKRYLSTSMEDCDVIIALENNVHFCQWAFASTPEHPILGRVLELIQERAHDFPHDVPDFVHWHTGPAVFTAGILDILGLDPRMNAAEAFKRIWTDVATQQRAHRLRACFLSDDFFSSQAITHQFSSQWSGKSATNREYQSWTEAAKQFSQAQERVTQARDMIAHPTQFRD